MTTYKLPNPPVPPEKPEIQAYYNGSSVATLTVRGMFEMTVTRKFVSIQDKVLHNARISVSADELDLFIEMLQQAKDYQEEINK